MRRALQVVLIVIAVVSGIMLYDVLRDAQWAHSWSKSLLIMLPELGTVVAVFELHHSAEANKLRDEHNVLARQNNELRRNLDDERNKHLAEIALHIQRPQTAAERNAAKLRQYLGSPIVVTNEDHGRWPNTPQIAEISDGNIAALFQPMQHGSQAYATYVDCADMEIIDVATGACPLQVKVNKRYGNPLQLGEITRWEDRQKPAAAPLFERGTTAYNARFSKQGSSETRTLFVYSSKDGANLFELEASTGEHFVGNNKAVSIRYLAQQVEYLSDGFQRSSTATGGGGYPLFIC